MKSEDGTDWSALRLEDRVAPGVRVLFVGINPGVRSALTGHHFAGFSNRFWRLLFESRLVPEAITWKDDGRLPEWGYGITNLIARPTPGINDLRAEEYAEGWTGLARKVRRYRPRILALVGVTVYRALLPHLRDGDGVGTKNRVVLGLQREVVHGARVFVLPNPSGRNANFTYAEMLAAFRKLQRALRESPGRRTPGAGLQLARLPSTPNRRRALNSGSDT